MRDPRRTHTSSFRAALAALAAGVLAGVLAAGCAPGMSPWAAGPGAEPVPEALAAAVAETRGLYFAQDFHRGAAVGLAALERWPAARELEVWTAINLARSDRATEAVERAEALVADRPDDAWGHIALAFALTYVPERRGEALEASARPLELAPTLPEAVWVRAFVFQNQGQRAEAVALITEKWPELDYPWLELKVVEGNVLMAMRADDPANVEAGLAILADVREQDPDNVQAHFFAGAVLAGDRRNDEAVPLMERASALSPGSVTIFNRHRFLIQARRDLDADERRERVLALAADFLAAADSSAASLRAVATAYRDAGLTDEATALDDRVLDRFAHSADAAWIRADRWRSLQQRIGRNEVEDTAAARAELRAMWWAFIDGPAHGHPGLRAEAHRNLFDALQDDPDVDDDTFLRLGLGAVEGNVGPGAHGRIAAGLADRGVHLDRARELAIEGLDVAERFVSENIANYDTPGRAADLLDSFQAEAYATLARVETAAGDLEAARDAIDQALERKPDFPSVRLAAGRLAEAEGDRAEAEIHYGRGFQAERARLGGDRPNQAALERIYLARHGAMDGYDDYVAGLEARDRERRWERVAASRLEEPRDLPALDLEWLDGGRIDPAETAGRIVVVNFWGVWCGPCVAEAPHIQAFHERYRDDPRVLFLTVNNDADPDKAREWMADNNYDWRVLLDEGFTAREGVRAWPTTWFAGTDGRIVFEHIGASAVVDEEFSWRVEILRADDAGTPVTLADIEP